MTTDALVPLATEHAYAQAPYQAITQDIFESAKSKLKPFSFASLNTDEAQDNFCDGDKCEIRIQRPEPEQQEIEGCEETPAEVEAEANESATV